MLSPRQIFEDNIRPADRLLKVFRLLEHDALSTGAELLRSLRELVGFPWTTQAVEAMRVGCLSLDELVMAWLAELQEQAAAAQSQRAA